MMKLTAVAHAALAIALLKMAKKQARAREESALLFVGLGDRFDDDRRLVRQ